MGGAWEGRSTGEVGGAAGWGAAQPKGVRSGARLPAAHAERDKATGPRSAPHTWCLTSFPLASSNALIISNTDEPAGWGPGQRF